MTAIIVKLFQSSSDPDYGRREPWIAIQGEKVESVKFTHYSPHEPLKNTSRAELLEVTMSSGQTHNIHAARDDFLEKIGWIE